MSSFPARSACLLVLAAAAGIYGLVALTRGSARPEALTLEPQTEPLDPTPDPTPHPRYNNYVPSARYLHIAGAKQAGVRTYDKWIITHRMQTLDSVLLMGVPGYDALIVARNGLTVYMVRSEDVRVRDDESRDLIAAAPTRNVGRVRLTPHDDTMRMSIATSAGINQSAELRPAPALEGPQTIGAVHGSNQGFAPRQLMYAPDAGLINRLMSMKGEYEIHLYFGSWCAVCEQYMGRILRVCQTELAEGSKKLNPKAPKYRLYFFGLPPMPQYQHHEHVKRLKIKKLPAGIVYKRGPNGQLKYHTRVEGTRWEKPEQSLYAAMKSPR